MEKPDDITHLEFEKLLEARGILDRGEIVHVQPPKDFFFFAPVGTKKMFNMTMWFYETSCGSIMCLGGLMQFLGAWPDYDASSGHRPAYSFALEFLFYPPNHEGDKRYYEITPHETVCAIDKFLAGAREEGAIWA